MSVQAHSAQSREDLALSHSCTWQTTCFSSHPQQGNSAGKQWCNRDWTGSQRTFRNLQKSLERILIMPTPPSRADLTVFHVASLSVQPLPGLRVCSLQQLQGPRLPQLAPWARMLPGAFEQAKGKRCVRQLCGLKVGGTRGKIGSQPLWGWFSKPPGLFMFSHPL